MSVVFGGDVVVYARDAALLRTGEWLNDTCINLGFKRAELELLCGAHGEAAAVLFVDPAVLACLMLQCEDDDEVLDMDGALRLTARRRVLFAVNNACGSFDDVCTHWSLLELRLDDDEVRPDGAAATAAAGPPRAASFHAYDSCGASNARAACAVAAQVTRLLRLTGVLPAGSPRPPLITEPAPQQRNGSDCGVYALLLAERLARQFLLGGSGGSSGRQQQQQQAAAALVVSTAADDWPALAAAKRDQLMSLVQPLLPKDTADKVTTEAGSQ